MGFNSRLDDKNRAVCPKSTKLQSVTLQYQFYFQKFSDFLRARTQNVHLMVLYYGESTKIRGDGKSVKPREECKNADKT